MYIRFYPRIVSTWRIKSEEIMELLGRIPTREQFFGNLLVGKLNNIVGIPAKPDEGLRLFFDANAIGNLWVAITWSE